MEKDDEVKGQGNSYTTEFRQYDSRIGRWQSVDLLGSLAPGWTPYRFAFNNPNIYTDNSGLFETKKEARKYRRGNKDVKGGIHKDKDGDYSIRSRKEGGTSYKAGDDSDIYGGAGDTHKNDGVVESGFVTPGKESSSGGWREKYFGWALSAQKSGSEWATNTSNDLTTAVRQVDDIMKPHKDEAIGTLKELYTIQAEVGGSGMATGISLGSIPKSKGVSVLGHYPDYVDLANKLNANRFQVPTDIWVKMSAAEQWAANMKFLDRMVKRGDIIKLATPINKVKPSSYYEKELKYLMSKGYKVSYDGSQLIR